MSAPLSRHGVLLIAGAALVLGVGSTAIAAAGGAFDSTRSTASAVSCQAPAAVGTSVAVTVTDMGGSMMRGGGSMMDGNSSAWGA